VILSLNVALILSGLVVILGAMCASPAVAAQPLAEVDGEAITADEVNKALRVPLGKLEEQIYHLKRQQVDVLVRERLLAQEAKRRGLSVQALLDREVTSKVTAVTEEEIEQFYRANKARFSGNEGEARKQIRNGLQGQKLAAKRDEFVNVLRSKAKVVIRLSPPPVVRLAVGVDGAPSKGSATAPVTIVEFSDYLCPFCQRTQPTLHAIERRYGDKVRFVFRDYPIEQLHPGATKAAEAARCATEQGKFWPYHDLLFQRQKAGPDELKGYAAEVGLDVRKFESCVTSGKHAASVQKDVEEGARLGVTGTPAFFINGRLVSGAQPVEAFAQIIDDELSRK
jgi:protein-disulfide isomerase